jgi:hypothetical protein
VSTPIVDVIISDLFFQPDEVLIDFDDNDDEDDGGAAAAIAKKAAAKAKQKTLALKLFVKEVANIDEDEYVVTIKGTMRYELAMDHVLTGMSFRQVAAAMQHTKECCSLSKLGGINDTIVGQYVHAGIAFASPTYASTSRSGHSHSPAMVVPTAASTSSTCACVCATAASC